MVVGIALVAHRRGGKPFAWWTLAIIAIYLAALSPAVLSSPWNPLIVLLSFVLVVLMAWSLALGDLTMLPWIVGVGSFVVQSHIGDLAAVAIAVTFGLVGCALHRLPTRRWISAGVVTAVVLAVMWIPPAIDQVSNPGGNLTDVVSWFHAVEAPITECARRRPSSFASSGAIPARALGTIGPIDGRARRWRARCILGIRRAHRSCCWSGRAWWRPGAARSDALVLCALNGLLIVASVVRAHPGVRTAERLPDGLDLGRRSDGMARDRGGRDLDVRRDCPGPGTPSAVAVAIICVVSAGNVVAAADRDAAPRPRRFRLPSVEAMLASR